MKRLIAALLLLASIIPVDVAIAHGQSTALVRVSTSQADASSGQLQLDLAIVDLEQAVGVDGNGDGAVTWGELRSRSPAIERYVRQHLKLSSGEGSNAADCELALPRLLVDEHADGPYAVLSFQFSCAPSTGPLALNYHLFFEQNPEHRGLVSRTVDGETIGSDSLSRSATDLTWDTASGNGWHSLAGWIGEGIWHIWTGLDHLLFLATLLLAAGRLGEVVKIVSAFTLSHSLTLIGGALGWIHFQSRWVEGAIALTVLIGAVNLVIPLARRRLWLLALGFGLVHGLGFASVLAGMQLDGAHLVRDLLGFNLGVEIGQLAVVVALAPAIHVAQRFRWYQKAFTPGAATAIGIIAAVWLVQRLG